MNLEAATLEKLKANEPQTPKPSAPAWNSRLRFAEPAGLAALCCRDFGYQFCTDVFGLPFQVLSAQQSVEGVFAG